MNVGAALDELSIGEFPYLENVRAIQQGGITTRPGQTDYSIGLPGAVHSIRTLNNVATGKTVNIIGADKSLYVQPNMAGSPALPIDTAYSGDPLSLVRFRPDQSPEAWMYVSDQNKMRKVSVESSLKNIGIAPPLNPLDAEISSADYCVVSDFLTATGWSGSSITQGTTSIPASTTIQEILYDNGIDGFGCVVPSSTDNAWALAGSRMILTGANTNIVTIEEVHNPISASTIVGIQYDEGSSGLCCIVLGTVTTGLDRNSIVLITSEYVRVLSVSVGPDGLYSFRCSTASSHVVGESVVGQTSLRIYTPTPNSNGDAITQVGLFFDCTAPTISGEILTVEVDTGGSGYSVSDLLFITQAGAFGGSVTVTSVSGGAVTGVTLTAGGSGYSPAYGLPVTGGHRDGVFTTPVTALTFMVSRKSAAVCRQR